MSLILKFHSIVHKSTLKSINMIVSKASRRMISKRCSLIASPGDPACEQISEPTVPEFSYHPSWNMPSRYGTPAERVRLTCHLRHCPLLHAEVERHKSIGRSARCSYELNNLLAVCQVRWQSKCHGTKRNRLSVVGVVGSEEGVTCRFRMPECNHCPFGIGRALFARDST